MTAVTTVRYAACMLAFMFSVVEPCLAQRLGTAPLEPGVAAVIERLYPGFEEVLESDDAPALGALARTLYANPSRESLSVLLWMLQFCPSWDADVSQLSRIVLSVGVLPVARIARVLSDGNADRRISAAVILGQVALVPPADRQDLQQTLITALSDSNALVREIAANSLRELNTADGNIALMKAAQDPDASDQLFWLATGRVRGPRSIPDASTFPATTVSAMRALDPNFLYTLGDLNLPGTSQILQALERSKDPDTTPVLLWLLLNASSHTWGPRIAGHLARPPHVNQLPIGELARQLGTVDSDHRAMIIELFDQLFRLKARPQDRETMITALLDRLDDSHTDVRRRAFETLSASQATVPVSAFLSALDGADVTTYFATQLLRMLRQPADRRALPVLERWARSAANPQLRREAALSYINIAQSQAPAREARRLLWEPATTALEQRVLADGRQALPIVWKALSGDSADDRRAAAALLGSFPDRNSIKPILAALDGSPGALTRDQLLFDLNMILLREGVTADREQRNTLAAEHLRWLYDQLASRSTRSEISSAFLSREIIAVFPDGIATPFSVDLSPYPTKAVRSESPEEFRRWVSKHGCGVAFHAINVAEGIARVATTVYLPGGVVGNQVWIGLYRLQGGRWVPLPTPPHMIVNGFFNGPNLRPTVRRDYGDDHPEKILALDLAMERIRADLAERASLEHEDSYWEIMKPRRAFDASYVALLQPYRSSDAPSIRYTAEYEIARITGRIDLAFWIDALVQQFGTPLQAMAHDVIVREASREIDSGSRELSGNTREELIRAALAPVSVDPRLLPKSLPRSDSIRQVRGSSRFGVVSVVSGTGPLGMSGYSMLFVRRASGWVFLCVFKSWIS